MAYTTVIFCLILGILVSAVESVFLVGRPVLRVGDNEVNEMEKSLSEAFKSRMLSKQIRFSMNTMNVERGARLENGTGCSCQGYNCGCCLNLNVPKIPLNETGCVNISYLPDEYGIELVVTVNGYVIIDEKVSVKNPPPICAAIPGLHKLASLCIRFQNLEVKNKQLSGCVDIEAELEGVVVEKFDLGCFHIPPGADSYGWKYGLAFKDMKITNFT